METSTQYLTFRDLQNCLTNHYRKYGDKINVAEAVSILHGKGKTISNIQIKPDFLSWDLDHVEQIWDIYQDMPIEVTYMLEHPNLFRMPIPETDSYFHVGDSNILIVLRDEKTKELQKTDFFKIVYVLQGKCNVFVENKSMVLNYGEVILLPPNTLHDHQPASGDSIVLQLSIRKSTFSKAFQPILEDNTILSEFFLKCLYESNQNFLLFYLKPIHRICSILQNMFFEEANHRPFANSIENCYVSIFLSELLCSYEENYEKYDKAENAYMKIPMILSYMKANFTDASLSSTAAAFGYEPSYFGKLIKKNTGRNFTDIINHYKVEHASQLLIHTSLSLDQVCSASGFHERDHFCRIFKKYTGETPYQYRKNINDQKDRF